MSSISSRLRIWKLPWRKLLSFECSLMVYTAARVRQALQSDCRNNRKVFSGSDTVLDCLEKLVTANVNRLVIVTEEDRVAGIVTVSDMIDFLVLRNCMECSPSRRNTRARPRTVSEGSPMDTEVTVRRKNTVSECVDVMESLGLDEHKVVIFNRLNSIAEADPKGNVTVISVKPSQASLCDSENTEDNSLGESEEASWSEDTPPASEHTDTPPPTWFSVN